MDDVPSMSGAASILEQMSGLGPRGVSPSVSSGRDAPERVVAVLSAAGAGRQALAELSVLLRLGCSLDVVSSPGLRTSRGLAARCGFYDISGDMPDGLLEGADCLVAVLDRGAAAKICLGLQDDLGSRIVLEGLWRGMDVYADLAGLMEPQTGREALRALYQGYVETLVRFGVQGIRRGSYVSALLERSGVRNPPEPNTNVTINTINTNVNANIDTVPASEGPRPVLGQRLVVTGRDVLEHASGTEWRLPPGAIVTDIARETARRMGVEMIAAPASGEGESRRAGG
ncbi:hypothetical protein [uncultured Fretibacterium sp.]|uniref:hypothetical protein n=1 Tax=uncultured Fretibacterium sp. TaxID=1678694 RepID=UPI0026339B32|nr:hypothetical protein [uncultured Fretibacterium sp.]